MDIRKIQPADKACVVAMMRDFYTSDAVLSNGSEKIYSDNVDNCTGGCPYLEGYVFEEQGVIQGYSLVAKGYATEFGKPCIWIEDLYIRAEYRGLGIGSRFLTYIGQQYPEAVLRLEVEEENTRAVQVYEKYGFRWLPYQEMIKIS